ncbi:MAG: response regulator [Steroidobacteraceae bacterium]|nr:response regulator [Steroidobacteraceae bacterium]
MVDDDQGIREGLSLLLQTVGQRCELYPTAISFLENFDQSRRGCLVLDVRMPRMTGLELQEKLKERGSSLPIIFITGHGDIPLAVEAMRRGALDFIRKPFREQELLDRINEALEFDSNKRKERLDKQQLVGRLGSLTKREREVFERVADGHMNKVIAFDLGLSERTVEVHRSHLMKKLGARTLAELIHIKIAVEQAGGA